MAFQNVFQTQQEFSLTDVFCLGFAPKFQYPRNVLLLVIFNAHLDCHTCVHVNLLLKVLSASQEIIITLPEEAPWKGDHKMGSKRCQNLPGKEGEEMAFDERKAVCSFMRGRGSMRGRSRI